MLLVDDDPTVAAVLGAFLRRLGCEVVTVLRYAEAAELLRSTQSWDLFVTDLQLDVGSGLELIRLARSRWLSLPTILISGSASSYLATAEGVDCFLAKPVSLAALAEQMERLIPGS